MPARLPATNRQPAVDRAAAFGRLQAFGRLFVEGSGGGGGGGDMNVLGRTVLTSGDLTTNSTSFVDATGAVVTCVTPAVNCLVIVSAAGNTSDAGQSPCLDLTIDGAAQGGTFGLLICSAPSNAVNFNACFVYTTAALSAASHTFQLRFRTTGGTFTLFASAAVCPIVISVVG